MSNYITQQIGIPKVSDQQALSGLGLLIGGLCTLSNNKQLRKMGLLTLSISTAGMITYSIKSAKKGILLNNNVIKYVKLGISPEESKYVELDSDNYINKNLMINGYNKLNVGENYKALLFLVQSDESFEIYRDKLFYYTDNLGRKYYKLFPTQNYRIGDIDDIWLKSGGTLNFKGNIQYKGTKMTYNEFVSYIKKMMPSIDNTPHYVGQLGVTLYNKNYKPDKYSQFSTNENYQIYINSNAPEVDQTCVFYHEICHAIFKIKGLKHSHTDNSIIFENEIKQREKEAELNYNLHLK